VKLVLVQPELAFAPDADNLSTIARVLEPSASALSASDLVLLPEHVDMQSDRAAYELGIRTLARRLGCHVVGGSHHEDRADGRINRGVVSDADGHIVGAYEKLRPYADERSRVQAGRSFGELTIGDRHVLILICADFWFSDVFARARHLPALVLVPALSVSRKPTPEYSRALWRHLAIARAYEFGVYVGVSDWAHVAVPGRLAPSGAGGFADPTVTDPDRLFAPIVGTHQIIELDFVALDVFRRDRMVRGFFWKTEL
jgi:predicted amidohydrolase